MKNLLYNKPIKTLEVPESWEELTTQQYLRIVELLHAGIQDTDIILDKALQILSSKSLYKFVRIPLDARLAAYAHITWLFEKQHEITKQFIPYYDGLYGPDSEFNNMKLAEFHEADMAFYIFHQEQNIDDLDQFIAVLYREPKKHYSLVRNPDGDIRVPFNYQDIEWNKRKTKNWPLHVKQAIAMWYSACKEMLRSLYPQAFEDGDQMAGYYEGMFSVIRNIAGDKYGSFADVENMYVHLAFKEITVMLHEQEELEKQLKSTTY